MCSQRIIGGVNMNYLFFIDDNENINKLQQAETTKILKELNLNDNIQIDSWAISLKSEEFNDDGTIIDSADDYTNNKIESLVDKIVQFFNDGAQKIELVIDLCLDDRNPESGICLAKNLIHNSRLENHFQNDNLLITLTSMYISADFKKLSQNKLTEETAQKIYYSHRPIKNDEFDKKRYAFPENYMFFKDYIHLEELKRLFLSQTYYGDFFGLIISRLVREKG